VTRAAFGLGTGGRLILFETKSAPMARRVVCRVGFALALKDGTRTGHPQRRAREQL